MSEVVSVFPKQIVVMQQGWQVIGFVEEVEGGVVVREASVIRQWGTTAGLGEIACKGATKTTVLDYTGEVRVPTCAIIMRITCKV